MNLNLVQAHLNGQHLEQIISMMKKFDRAVKIARLARDNGTDIVAGVKGGSWYVIGYANHTL